MFNKFKPYSVCAKRILIRLPCTGEEVDETDVDIDNIEEDMQGRDVVTFRCPHCAEIHKSHRFGR